jgi:hypothetical protein
MLDFAAGSFAMNGEGIESELKRLTKKHLSSEQRKAIGQLSLEWGVLHSTENVLFKLMAKHYETERSQPGVKRPPELAELESQQWKIFERKREIGADLVELENGVVPRRRPPGRKMKVSVLVRNMVIRASENTRDADICQELDLQLAQRDMPPLGLPESWTKNYNVKSFYQAYRHP